MRIVYFMVLVIIIPLYVVLPLYLERDEDNEGINNPLKYKMFLANSIFWFIFNSSVFWSLLF
jgi:hypothetical protein